MAFVVEDGTGLSTANSYADVAFADAYFADRGITDWAGEDLQKQGWLVQGTDYINSRFGSILLNEIAFPGIQALDFPRVEIDTQVVSPVALPVNLQRATCEYALRAKKAPLSPDPVVDPSGYKVQKTHKKLGPLEKDISYAAQGPDASLMLLRPYPAADMLMRGLIRNSQGKVIRN